MNDALTIVGLIAAPLAGLGGVALGQFLSRRATAEEHQRQRQDELEDRARERATRLLRQANQFESAAGGLFHVIVQNHNRKQRNVPPTPREEVVLTLRQMNTSSVEFSATCLEVEAQGPEWAVGLARSFDHHVRKLVRSIDVLSEQVTQERMEPADRLLNELVQMIDDAADDFRARMTSGGEKMPPMLATPRPGFKGERYRP